VVLSLSQSLPLRLLQDAISNFTTEQEIASAIKSKIEKQYQGSWHCFVGRNFGSVVTHEASRFIYFYIGQMGITLFATA
jgi:dynein light chain LC8-type